MTFPSKPAQKPADPRFSPGPTRKHPGWSLQNLQNAVLGRNHRSKPAVARIKRHTDLPVCVGFGIKSAEDAEAIGRGADGVVVGSAIVSVIADCLDADGRPASDPAAGVARLVGDLAAGTRKARLAATA